MTQETIATLLEHRMKLISVTRVLNEADIVEAFIRHNAGVVDHQILLDNGSTDATLDILARLQTEGTSLEVHHHAAVAFAEADQNNFLFRLAAGERGADWVLPLDVDEFIDERAAAGGLRALLQGETGDAVKIRVREYIPTPEDNAAELLVPARITWARDPTDNMKVIARGKLLEQSASLQPGGHSIRAMGEDVAWRILPGVLYAHYATRSPWQWISKFTIGWSKILAAGPTMVASGNSVHYREPFRVLKTDPAQIMRNPFFIEFRHNEPGLSCDPLPYLGTALRYTEPVDHQMRAVQALMVHLERLSIHHGELVEAGAT